MKYGRYIACNLLIVLILLSARPSAGADSTCNAADQQLGFAESLFKEGDYFRSITEYKRFIYHYPKDVRVEQAFFKIAESFYRAERWLEAEEAFQAFAERFPDSRLRPEAVYLKAVAEKNQRKFDQAIITIESLINISTGSARDRAVYLKGLIELERADWKRAKGAFDSVSPESSLYSSSYSLSQSLSNADNLPQKNPSLAGTLAAILPGAGHLYTERPRDAAVSFLLNAAFIAAAVQLFRHENEIAGGIAAFFELGWYSGNIYSAVSSAHKYNENIKTDFIHKLKRSSRFSLERCPSGLCFMYSFNY
jgi:tetratricopeptide (TPR) repeat protein